MPTICFQPLGFVNSPYTEVADMPIQSVAARGVAGRVGLRPNAIGLSAARLIRVGGLVLHIEEVDVVDGTPPLDIKPFVPAFDHRDTDRIGWFEGNVNRVATVRADARVRRPPSPGTGSHSDGHP